VSATIPRAAKKGIASRLSFSRRAVCVEARKPVVLRTDQKPPIAPGRFPEFPCARGARSAESSRGWGATAVPGDASTTRTRRVKDTGDVPIAGAGRARPRWARARPAPRARRARGGGRRRDGRWARRIGLRRRRCRSRRRARGGRRRARRGDAPCVAKQRSTRRALRRWWVATRAARREMGLDASSRVTSAKTGRSSSSRECESKKRCDVTVTKV
jgi:hypothetical protein